MPDDDLDMDLVMGGAMPPEASPTEPAPDYGPPPEYYEAITDALPELDEMQQTALWDAIAACVDARLAGG